MINNELDTDTKDLIDNATKLLEINKEHQRINGELREELEFEKTTNKELLSTGADLEKKLYEEQDKNKRLNNIIKEVREYIKEMQVYCIEFESWGVPSKELLEILDKENK